MVKNPLADRRWLLYRVLAEPLRLRLLALAAEEELSVGELAELLAEGQPNVSRHAAALRKSGILDGRRQGTRTLVSLGATARDDAVVADALQAGRRLCQKDGSLDRVGSVVRARDARGRDYFAKPLELGPLGVTPELPAFAAALGPLVSPRRLAVDAGTGDGALLDVLAPVFDHVLAVDRSEAQLARARQRVEARGYTNVELICGEADSTSVRASVGPGADLVIACRVLHHAPLPRSMMLALSRLVVAGGRLAVIDYLRHEDDEFRERQADVWLGFEPEELEELGVEAGLLNPRVRGLPDGFVTGCADAYLGWLLLEGALPASTGAVGPDGQTGGSLRSGPELPGAGSEGSQR